MRRPVEDPLVRRITYYLDVRLRNRILTKSRAQGKTFSEYLSDVVTRDLGCPELARYRKRHGGPNPQLEPEDEILAAEKAAGAEVAASSPVEPDHDVLAAEQMVGTEVGANR